MKKSKVLTFLVTFFAAIAIALIATQIRFDYLEGLLYDFRMRISPSPKVSKEIVLISIEESFIKTNGRTANVIDHIELLKMLSKVGPKAVLYVEDPSKIQGTLDQKRRFSNLAASIPNLYYVSQKLPVFGSLDRLKLPLPFENFPTDTGAHTFDSGIFANDRVTRRLMYTLADHLWVQVRIASLINPNVMDKSYIRGAKKIMNSIQTHINYNPQGSFKKILLEKTLDGSTEIQEIKDKILILGSNFNLDSTRGVATPLDRERFGHRMPIHELNANIINTLANNVGIYQVPEEIDFPMAIFISFIIVGVILYLNPAKSLIILATVFLSFSLFAIILFAGFGIWLNMAKIYLTVFLTTYFLIPARLIRENKKMSLLKIKLANKEVEKEKQLTMAYRRLAHDIRSPLTALNALLYFGTETENSQKIMSAAVERINAIANSLLLRGSTLEKKKKSTDITILNSGIISICEEKTAEYRDLKYTSISVDVPNVLCFAKIGKTDLSRMLSNLINNAVEAIGGEKGTIRLTLIPGKNGVHHEIHVDDNGPGIPQEVLKKVNAGEIVSSGKNTLKGSGHGLGVKTTHDLLRPLDGHLIFSNLKEKGTRATIKIPAQEYRSEYCENLNLPRTKSILVIDDDSSVHELWQRRFKSEKLDARYFTTLESAQMYIQDLRGKVGGLAIGLVLCDYRFSNNTENGLDFIEKFCRDYDTILVTTEFEEADVLERARKYSVKILPKFLLAKIEINICDSQAM